MMLDMRKNLTTAAIGAVITVAAIMLGIGAISFVRAEVSSSGPNVLSSDQVDDLAASSSASPSAESTPSPSSSPSSSPDDSPSASPTSSGFPTSVGEQGTAVLTSSGGSAVVACTDAGVVLVSWAPAPGFEVDDSLVRGPAREIEIEFRSATTKAEMYASCNGGSPTSRVEVKSIDTDDNRGPGGGDDNGGDDGDDNSGPGGGDDDNSGSSHSGGSDDD